MEKTQIDECPSCIELDILAAELAGYIHVPIDTAKLTPPELKDVSPTENRYVYTVSDGRMDENGVWRRRHGGGDFYLWSPSRYIRDAWDLINLLIHHPDNNEDSRWYCTMYSNPVGDFVVMIRHSDSREANRSIGEEYLAITRSFCKAMGITEVEIDNVES